MLVETGPRLERSSEVKEDHAVSAVADTGDSCSKNLDPGICAGGSRNIVPGGLPFCFHFAVDPLLEDWLRASVF